VFGVNGQLARELAKYPCVYNVGRPDVDLLDFDKCKDRIRRSNASAIINAAAYTQVDLAEKENELAELINGEAPGVLATSAAETGIPFVHVSTDYVFDGFTQEKPWSPEQRSEPINAYGRSKLLGEKRIAATGANFVILRTSWVFSKFGRNFVRSIYEKATTENSAELQVVADQCGGPTPASSLASACIAVAMRLMVSDLPLAGTYHYAGYPDTTWFEFAKKIIRELDLGTSVTPVSSTEFKTTASRPLNSSLNCESFETAFDIKRPYWPDHVKPTLDSLRNGQTT